MPNAQGRSQGDDFTLDWWPYWLGKKVLYGTLMDLMHNPRQLSKAFINDCHGQQLHNHFWKRNSFFRDQMVLDKRLPSFPRSARGHKSQKTDRQQASEEEAAAMRLDSIVQRSDEECSILKAARIKFREVKRSSEVPRSQTYVQRASRRRQRQSVDAPRTRQRSNVEAP